MTTENEYKTCENCCHQQYHEDGYICYKDGTYRVYKSNEAMRCKKYEIGEIYKRCE